MEKHSKDKIDKAKKLYKKGEKLADIARQLDVPAGTIRRWKSEQDWASKRSNKKSEHYDSEKKKKKTINNKIAKDLVENTELTDKQKLFCIYYVKYFNATKAYQKAYKCSYNTAMVEGCRKLKNPKILEEVKELKENKFNRALLGKEDIFQKYIDIAFSDITDYIDFGNKEVEKVDNIGRTYEEDITYAIARNSDEVDGTLISEISSGQSGVKIKLHDKMKALQWLSDHMDIATEEQRERVNKLKLDNELAKLRIANEKNNSW